MIVSRGTGGPCAKRRATLQFYFNFVKFSCLKKKHEQKQNKTFNIYQNNDLNYFIVVCNVSNRMLQSLFIFLKLKTVFIHITFFGFKGVLRC